MMEGKEKRRAPNWPLSETEQANTLELLALQALARGDIAVALRNADRRCRISPLADAVHFTLRAEILDQLGFRRDALVDITRALELAPEDLAANRRMLGWGAGNPRLLAARTLIKQERDVEVLASALRILATTSERAFGALYAVNNNVQGWCAWSGEQSPTLRFTNEDGSPCSSKQVRLGADLKHPLCGVLEHAANFAVDVKKSSVSQRVELRVGRRTLGEILLSATECARVRLKIAPPLPAKISTNQVTVIIPIYADYFATTTCIDLVTTELDKYPEGFAVLVDDASPDLRIRAYLDAIHHPRIRLLRNARNLGFAASVNRAFAITPFGDCILVNADTLVPPDFIARLRSTTMTDSKIGTVTPLSNNGEFMSFPLPNVSNPLPSVKEAFALDSAARGVNRGRIVDIPSGVGFCLYVTRACLDEIGPLSIDFQRGYLEDVDFCLRARSRGYRNVCDPSVYVGHAGSRSFAADKRALVVRNLQVLESRFPSHRAECAAFMKADPLRSSRAAIEFALPLKKDRTIVLVTGAGNSAEVAQARACHLRADGFAILIATIDHAHDRPVAELTASHGGVPQSLRFFLDEDERGPLAEFLDRLAPVRLEIVSSVQGPPAFVDWLFSLATPIDILLAEVYIMVADTPIARKPNNDTDLRQKQSESCTPGNVAANDAGSFTANQTFGSFWELIGSRANRILAPCPVAADFARNVLGLNGTVQLPPRTHGSKVTLRASHSSKGMLGIYLPGLRAAEYSGLKALLRLVAKTSPEKALTVLGETLDDFGLMEIGNVFVTGKVDYDEFSQLLQHYNIRALFLANRRPLFGHPGVSRLRRIGLPVAFFDWSFGRIPAAFEDLPMAPDASPHEAAAMISAWQRW